MNDPPVPPAPVPPVAVVAVVDPIPTVPRNTLTPTNSIPISSPQGFPSPTSSPPYLPFINNSDYRPVPGDHTVIRYPPFNLPGLGITINTLFRCIVCMTCRRAIDCEKLIDHIRKDLPLVKVPDELPSKLQEAYDLVPYHKATVHASGPIPPVFGIPLQEAPLFFCQCGRGYVDEHSLRFHQTTRQEGRQCILRTPNPKHTRGYGQQLAGNRPFFQVDVNAWRRTSEDEYDCPLAYRKHVPSLPEYTKMEIAGAEDEMNIASFFYKERWLRHLKDYTTDDVLEACKDATPDVSYGALLREVSYLFLLRANRELENHSSFGLPRLMGQTTERETLHRFDPISEPSVRKYSLTLHRLVFGVLRQMDPTYAHKYRYPPLHPLQLVPLQALASALALEPPASDLIDLFQAGCFSIFAHHQHKYETSKNLDQFFSPAICFLIINSVEKRGGFKLFSIITQTAAHLMFSNRSVMLDEVKRKALSEGIGYIEYVFFFYFFFFFFL